MTGMNRRFGGTDGTRAVFGLMLMVFIASSAIAASGQAKEGDLRQQIIEAMDSGDDETVCKLAKADPGLFDAKGKDGKMPLHVAASKGEIDLVELLLANNADVNVMMADGRTPLMFAAYGGHGQTVGLLLDQGADIDARTKKGVPAAAGMDAKPTANAEAFGPGSTALVFASKRGHKGVMDVLIARGADPKAKDDGGATCLIWAAGSGHQETVQLLLAHGADINARTANGMTALSAATRNGHTQMRKFLVEHGAK